MYNLKLKDDNVSICYKDNCIEASGQNAKLIAFSAFAILLLAGMSELASNS